MMELGALMKEVGLQGPVGLVSDTNVHQLYGETVTSTLRDAGYRIIQYVFPAGEESKNWDRLRDLLEHFLQQGMERNGTLVALGGGVVGDLTGFAAAIILRGVTYVQVPTTLLAQVDSSVGGKTGVNLTVGKNLAGCFYAPRLVLADPRVLATLPVREWTCGLAELAKMALIRDAELVTFLEKNLAQLVPDAGGEGRELDWELVSRAVLWAARLKGEVVAQDEREQDLRRILNFGHTLGHALEAAGDYRWYRHGEAILLGMWAALRLGVLTGDTPEEVQARATALLQRIPWRGPQALPDREKVTAALEFDKKKRQRVLVWVLLRNIGNTVLRTALAPQLVKTVLDELYADFPFRR